MSARPVVPRLDPEDLDLLISRSLDGDLAAEEEQELQQILAADPEAARRRDELAGVIAALQALPNHEPPFAIATRVNVQVADRAKGLGSAWHRFGLYPPPGLVGAAIAVLVGLGLASAFFTTPRLVPVAPAPAPAKKPGGPVEVFFQSNEKDAPAAVPAPEPKTMIAESQLRRQAPATRLDQVSSATRAEDRETGAGVAGKRNEDSREKVAKKDAGRTGALESKVSGSIAAASAEQVAASDSLAVPSSGAKENSVKEEAQAADNKQLAKLKAAGAPRDEASSNAVAGGGLVAQAPAESRAAAPALPAAPAARLRAQLSASKPRWSISIVGPAQIGASWRLKKTPTTAPPDRPVTVLYRLTLDRTGHVVSARPQNGAVPVEVDEMVRGLLFEPAGEAGENREVEVEITAK